MSSSGPNYPTGKVTASTAPYTGINWTTIANIGADDGTYSSITISLYDANQWSYEVRATGFSFAIPAGQSIDGITVEVEGYGANGASSPQHVQLTKNGTAAVGSEKGSSTSWGASAEVRTFGGSADTWGESWTVDEINASTFGVLFANKATANDADVYIDYIRITVTYTEGGGGASAVPVIMNSYRQRRA